MTIYKCSIIADPEGNAWEFAKEIYENLRARSDKFELNRVNIHQFGDGEIKPKIEKNVRRKNCFFIHDSGKNPAEWFLELALVLETLRNSSAQEIISVLPYLRFSRQDRKDESRVPINAKVVADIISKYADRVLTIDVHNPSIQGFYDIPFDNLYSFQSVVNYLKRNHKDFLQNLVVMSPDAGGGKRAEAFAKRIGVEGIAIGHKTREKAGEVSKLQVIGDIEDKNILIVDDIVESGGTLIKAYKALKEGGAKKVYAYCTHGLFTKGTEELTKNFDLIIVGDSFIRPGLELAEKVNVVSFADLFAEAIFRINDGLSLSQLFE